MNFGCRKRDEVHAEKDITKMARLEPSGASEYPGTLEITCMSSASAIVHSFCDVLQTLCRVPVRQTRIALCESEPVLLFLLLGTQCSVLLFVSAIEVPVVVLLRDPEESGKCRKGDVDGVACLE
ncbi:unnamed protein product, partial [Mycena citricolor]